MADQRASISPQRMGLILLALLLCAGIFLAWFFWSEQGEDEHGPEAEHSQSDTQMDDDTGEDENDEVEEQEGEPEQAAPEQTTSEGSPANNEDEAAPSGQSPEAPSVSSVLETQPTVEGTAEGETAPEAEIETGAAESTDTTVASLNEEVGATDADAPAVTDTEEASAVSTDGASVSEGENASTSTVATVTDADDSASAEPAATASDDEAMSDAAVVQAPEIDIVRVDPDGTAVIAGRAHAAGRIELWRDGTPIDGAVMELDEQGEFAMFATIPFSTEPSSLEIAHFADGAEKPVMSAQRVLIAALPKPETDTAVAAGAGDAATTTNTAVAAASGVEGEGDVTVTQESPPVVLIEDNEGLRVIQSGSEDFTPLVTFTLDTISYESDGTVEIGGRSGGNGFVRIYLDNKPITTAQIDEGGHWRASLANTETGIYTLRVDELDADGNVTARVETPFKREEPELLAEFTHDTDGRPDYDSITIQYGHTLWAIARERYGHGIEYFKVFEANRDRIKDPDLIYPGQVFDIPD